MKKKKKKKRFPVHETGRVTEVTPNAVIITPEKSASCTGCINLRCKSGAFFISAENPLNLPVEKGQLVELRVLGRAVASQTLIALGPPVLAFITAFFLTRLFAPLRGEGLAAILGLFCFFAAAAVVFFLRKNFPPAGEVTVARIIPEAPSTER